MSSNALGLDGISLKMINCLRPFLLPALEDIVNFSLQNGTFPKIWKHALVIPLPKTSNPSSPADFRAISILPCLSKILESAVLAEVTGFLNRFSLLDKFQSGFRARHSTTTALTKVIDDIGRELDKGKLTLMVLFDFTKAFDSISHKILLEKMRILGFSDSVIAWFRSYLNGRSQVVSSAGSISQSRPVCQGVPQGSILGPILFSLFVNDLSRHLSHVNYHFYADDLQIYASALSY